MLGGILDAIEDGAMIMAREGTVLYCNEALLGWMGVSLDEIIGASIYDFIPERAHQRRKGFFDEVAQTGKGLHFYEEWEGCWFEHRVYPVLDDDGLVSSFAVYTIDVTVQRNAEERLRAGEALLREVLNVLPVGMRALDQNREIMRENPAARRIWSADDDQSGAAGNDRFVEALEQYNGICSAALKGKATMGQEIHLGSDVLQSKTIIQSGFPLTAEDGKIIGAVAVTEDISEIRQGSELLQIQLDLAANLSAISDTEQALRLCLDVALRISGMDGGGVYVVDPRTGAIDLAVYRNLPDNFVSACSRYDSGTRNARIVKAGKPVYSSFQETKLNAYGTDMVSVVVIPISYEGKVVACLNLGSRLPVLPEGKIRVAIETVAAQMGGAFVRMRAEEERLRLAEMTANEEMFRMLASHAPIGIFLTDKQGRCRYVNEQWCRMAGITGEQAMGMGWSDAVHPEDRDSLLADWRAATRRARKFDTEHRFRTEDGGVVWVAISGVPLRDKEGRAIGYVGTAKDITERKRAEEESRNLSRHLQTVREEERRKMSREIHDELGQSLTAAKMELGLLSTGLLEQPERFFEKVKAIKTLIDASIQTVKRVSSGLRPLVLDELGLCSAIEWQAAEFQKRTGIVCEVACVEPDDFGVDQQISTAIFRIFQEALTNVARHAAAKRVSIRVMIEEEGVLLKVSDNGKGIERDKVESPNSFGLIGMRERAHAYGGVFEIAGVPRRGTKLSVTIPFNEKRGDS